MMEEFKKVIDNQSPKRMFVDDVFERDEEEIVLNNKFENHFKKIYANMMV